MPTSKSALFLGMTEAKKVHQEESEQHSSRLAGMNYLPCGIIPSSAYLGCAQQLAE